MNVTNHTNNDFVSHWTTSPKDGSKYLYVDVHFDEVALTLKDICVKQRSTGEYSVTSRPYTSKSKTGKEFTNWHINLEPDARAAIIEEALKLK